MTANPVGIQQINATRRIVRHDPAESSQFRPLYDKMLFYTQNQICTLDRAATTNRTPTSTIIGCYTIDYAPRLVNQTVPNMPNCFALDTLVTHSDLFISLARLFDANAANSQEQQQPPPLHVLGFYAMWPQRRVSLDLILFSKILNEQNLYAYTFPRERHRQRISIQVAAPQHFDIVNDQNVQLALLFGIETAELTRKLVNSMDRNFVDMLTFAMSDTSREELNLLVQTRTLSTGGDVALSLTNLDVHLLESHRMQMRHDPMLTSSDVVLSLHDTHLELATLQEHYDFQLSIRIHTVGRYYLFGSNVTCHFKCHVCEQFDAIVLVLRFAGSCRLLDTTDGSFLTPKTLTLEAASALTLPNQQMRQLVLTTRHTMNALKMAPFSFGAFQQTRPTDDEQNDVCFILLDKNNSNKEVTFSFEATPLFYLKLVNM
jgi:hypothetical protein